MNALKQSRIWVNWISDPIHGKIPKNPQTSGYAKSNDPTTWTTYEQARIAAQKEYDGVMFALTDGICGIDIDSVNNSHGREKLAKEIIDLMDTHTEYSPSGNGYHIIFRCNVKKIPQIDGKLDHTYYQKNPHNGVECYISGLTNRFFTYTGRTINNRDIEERTEQLLTFLRRYMKKENPPASATNVTGGFENGYVPTAHTIITIAQKAKNHKKFIALYKNGDISSYNNDDSAADIALCSILAFWCGNNPVLIDEIFRSSALYRPKWEREDYCNRTIEMAIIRQNGVFYDWTKKKTRTGKPQAESTPIKTERYAWANYANPFETPELKQLFAPNEIGAGNLFAYVYKNLARYVPQAKSWAVYDNRVWKLDEGSIIVAQLAKDLLDYMLECEAYIDDEAELKIWHKFVIGLRRRQARDTMLKDAESIYPINISDFDKNPYLFNCLNCTINLRDFTVYEHRPEDLLSKISNVSYDPMIKCERWESFVDEVMCGDVSKTRFLQKSLGYALAGDTFMECFFILYGSTTRNGKGTTMETTLHLMGDYGSTAQPSLLAKKHFENSGAPSEEIASLKGIRFLNVSEPAKGLRLDEALLKQMTGGDKMKARLLYQNSFVFLPEFKLFINTNYLPQVTDDTIFKSGRVKLIPFERHFAENEQDKGLKELFKKPESVSGIFNWMIEGLKLLMDEGLNHPKSIEEAVNQYWEESDIVGMFIRECIGKTEMRKTPMTEIYSEYKEWCEVNGNIPLANVNLIKDLKRRGFIIKRSTGNKSYLYDYGLIGGTCAEITEEAFPELMKIDSISKATLGSDIDFSDFDI